MSTEAVTSGFIDLRTGENVTHAWSNQQPIDYIVSLRAICSSDALAMLKDNQPVSQYIAAIYSMVKSLHPDWDVLCYLSRSPDELGNRPLLKYETHIGDAKRRDQVWDWILDQSRDVAERIAEAHGLPWQKVYASISVILW